MDNPNLKWVICARWGPPVISWFINPINYIVISTINHSYWTYVHQLNYRGRGAPPCGIAPCVVVVSGSADAEVDAVVSSVLDVK